MNDQENEEGFLGVIEKVPEDEVVWGVSLQPIFSKFLDSSVPLYLISTLSVGVSLELQLDIANGIVVAIPNPHVMLTIVWLTFYSYFSPIFNIYTVFFFFFCNKFGK